MNDKELISEARREESIHDKLGDGFSEGSEERAFYYEHRDRYKRLADALEVRQPSEEGEYILRLIETIKQTGGSVEVSGVKIMPCDEFGRTAAVPDAATERVTENSVRHVKRLTTELQNKRESLNDQRREFRNLLAKARAERDAANRELTEAIRLTVEYVGYDMLPAIEGWDWYDALVKYAPEVAQAFADKPIHFPKSAERDAALAAIGRVQETLSLHNPNGRLVKEVLAALDGAPEPEWEWGWMADKERRASMSPRGPRLLIDGHPHTPEEIARFPRGQRVRRRKAGPWEPVEGNDAEG